jgi:uncharacterized protein (TIGR04222 family)
MSQPWGLSGPQFLVIYGVGTAVVIVVPFLLRLLIRFVSSADAGRQLDPYEVGYLAGGPARAAQVVITDFVASGAVRADSSGRVTVADRTAFDRQSAFLNEGVDPRQPGGTRGRILEGVSGVTTPFPELWMPAGVLVHQFQAKIARLPAITAIRARLRAEGLLVSSARAAMVRIVSLALWAALFVTGGLRLAEGAHNHRPIGNLQGLVVLSAFACLVSLAANWSRLTNLTTFRGARLLRGLRSAERRREKDAARQGRLGAAAFSPGLAADGSPGLAADGFGFGVGTGSAALFGVALVGFAAVEDESMRSALLAGLPSSSGGSSCGGGGGGCGGGGCGGGCGG